MVEGFMASFIFGFLGTAGPKITSAPHFSLSEVGSIFTLDLLTAGFHIGGADRGGDICFCRLFTSVHTSALITVSATQRFAATKFCSRRAAEIADGRGVIDRRAVLLANERAFRRFPNAIRHHVHRPLERNR